MALRSMHESIDQYKYISPHEPGVMVDYYGYSYESRLKWKVELFKNEGKKYPSCIERYYGRWGKSPYYWTGLCAGCGKRTRRYQLITYRCGYVAKHNRKKKRCVNGHRHQPFHWTDIHNLDIPLCSKECKTLFVFKYGLA